MIFREDLSLYNCLQRLIPARSPNLEEITPNMILARSPYHFIKDLLLETETCTRLVI